MRRNLYANYCFVLVVSLLVWLSVEMENLRAVGGRKQRVNYN